MSERAQPYDGFEDFFRRIEPRLRSSLVASYGAEVGREATVDALTWAWRNWRRTRRMAHPLRYLFRVGQSAARRSLSKTDFVMPVLEQGSHSETWFEPRLLPTLRLLTFNQRVAVVLCYGMEWTQAEVAELLGVSTSTVQTHLERGMKKLREIMEVEDA